MGKVVTKCQMEELEHASSSFRLPFWSQFGLSGEDGNHLEKNQANKMTPF